MSPQRIASLLASATEILYGIGLGDRVVAISHECDYPPEVANKPRVTHSNINDQESSRDIDDQVRDKLASKKALYEIDAHKLSALKPDLIITQSQCEVCAVDYKDVIAKVRNTPALKDCHVVDLNPTTLDAIFEDIDRVGKAAGAEGPAKRYINSLRARVEAVKYKTAKLSKDDKPRVVCIEWIEPVMVAANWMPEIIDIAGGQCSLTQTGEQSTYTKWEEVVAYDPEVIVVMPCGFGLDRTIQESQRLRELADWLNLTAVKSERVYAVDGNTYFNRSGPRVIDSLEILAHILHPVVIPLTQESMQRAWSKLSF